MFSKNPMPTVTSYVTTKHSLKGLTKSLASETRELGIRVNAVCPGLIRKDIFKEKGPNTSAAMGLEFGGWISELTEDTMIKQLKEASQVAAMCAFFAPMQKKVLQVLPPILTAAPAHISKNSEEECKTDFLPPQSHPPARQHKFLALVSYGPLNFQSWGKIARKKRLTVSMSLGPR